MKKSNVVKVTTNSREYNLSRKTKRTFNRDVCPYCPLYGGENYWHKRYSYRLYRHTTWKRYRRTQYKLKMAS